jgi:hypothetical protein
MLKDSAMTRRPRAMPVGTLRLLANQSDRDPQAEGDGE